jgi:Ca2+-binding EF-hand superfamily protein
MRFETEDLRMKRLSNIIERVATAFYVQNFNLRRAFSLFDRDGDGSISYKEFR